MKFGMFQVRENKISLRKWSGGTAQLHTLEGMVVTTICSVFYMFCFCYLLLLSVLQRSWLAVLINPCLLSAFNRNRL